MRHAVGMESSRPAARGRARAGTPPGGRGGPWRTRPGRGGPRAGRQGRRDPLVRTRVDLEFGGLVDLLVCEG